MNNFDLHMHTTASDGTDAPEELLEKLIKSGIRTFAVTDHDTIDGAMKLKGKVPDDMMFFPGVEFSCYTPVKKCHILGYCYDENNPDLIKAISYVHEVRQKKLELRLAQLEKRHGITFSADEIAELDEMESPGKPKIAELIVRHGLASNTSEAFERYIDDLIIEPMYERIPAEEAISAIISAGGVPVWAHPLGGIGETRLTEEQAFAQLEVLKGFGLKGMECFYSLYEETEIRMLCGLANESDLFISAGSDYHGKNKSVMFGTLRADDKNVDVDDVTLIRELKKMAGSIN